MRLARFLPLLLGAACSALEPDPLPPYGQAVVVVDTDLPVPSVVSKLRIDLLDERGNVFDRRDELRLDPRDWPTSFGVFTDDPENERTVFVRLRAYSEGRVERGTEDEPDPDVTVDRLVRVRLVPGERARVRVLLSGDCAGVRPTLVPFTKARSCIDGRRPDARVADATVDTALRPDTSSAVGTHGHVPCDGVIVPPDRACVPGGTFIFGDRFSRDTSPYTEVALAPLDSHYEKVVTLSRFAIDRDEVTVARYRAALARGFVPPVEPITTVDSGDESYCTLTSSPRGLEHHPISCVPWITADAFCRFEGGSLPTEAQWEYAALAAGRVRKVRYTWGDDPPSCDRAVYGRIRLAGPRECPDGVDGPAPIRDRPLDVNPLGVHDLNGSLSEHVLDSDEPYDGACWRTAPARDPSCLRPPSAECAARPTSRPCIDAGGWNHVTRGGSWATLGSSLRGARRRPVHGALKSDDVGFRCAYPAP